MYKSLRNTLSDEQLSKLYRADLNFAKDMMSKGKVQIEQRPAPQQKGGAQPPRTGQRPAPDGKK